jgi:hypothetical protein
MRAVAIAYSPSLVLENKRSLVIAHRFVAEVTLEW